MISADFIKSSGVNKNLTDVYSQLLDARKGPSLMPTQIEVGENAFEEFQKEITHKFSDM